MKRTVFFIVILVLLCSSMSVFADLAKTEQEYREEQSITLPETLKMGSAMDCGDYTIRMMALPSGTTSILGNNAGTNKKYLILRLGITNNSDHMISWLDEKSFSLREYYMGEYYGTYALNQIVGAKAAQSIGFGAYFMPIQPGEELSTVIAFEVFPGADGWVMTFSPFTREEDGPKESIEFKIPDVIL